MITHGRAGLKHRLFDRQGQRQCDIIWPHVVLAEVTPGQINLRNAKCISSSDRAPGTTILDNKLGANTTRPDSHEDAPHRELLREFQRRDPFLNTVVHEGTTFEERFR
jgi:hypothetical protein